MTFKILAASCLSILSTTVQAQYFCGTDDVYNHLKSTNPEIAKTEALLEQEIQNKLQYLDWSKLAKTTAGDTVQYDVPIVVHIIHDYGVEYVPDNTIFEAVKNWTEVFQASNADTASVIPTFKPYIGNARIRFRLATKDPQGNPTKGITRRQSYLTHNAGDQAKLDGWPNNSYINLWFINKFSNDHSGAAAYAYYPSMGDAFPYYDGIIGLYNYINYDKTIPHELGHVLNLQHVWGNTNQPEVACGDDLVADTPPTKGHAPIGCTPSILYDQTCAENYFVVMPDGTIIDYPDTTNSQNIMDYSYCYRMFTKGQAERMRAALTSSVAGRNNLYKPANLAATGALDPRPDLPPIADFSVERPLGGSDRGYFLCAGSSNNNPKFVFRNRSWNDTVTSVSWTISNDAETPTSNSLTSVSTHINTPGWVTISLTATGNNSGSTTHTDTRAVYAADPNAKLPAGYHQSFKNLSEMAEWPIFNLYKNNFQWEWVSDAGYQSHGCIRYRSFDARSTAEQRTGTPNGDYDDIISPAFDLSEHAGGGPLNLNFMTSGSFTGNGSTPNDSMQILVSVDCGKTWKRITCLTGNNLINKAKQASEYKPISSGDWKAQTITIPEAYRTSRAFFKFRYFPTRSGNNLYMDEFSITPYTTEVKEVAQNHNQINLYPNPTSQDVTLVFHSGTDGKASIGVKDIQGKTIIHLEKQYTAGTVIKEQLFRNIFPAPGIYFVSVTIAHNTVTRKLIIE